ANGLRSNRNGNSSWDTACHLFLSVGFAYAGFLVALFQRVKFMADANTSTKPDRKAIGRGIGLAIVICAVLVCIIAIWVYINRPETDDATMRANFIGIAPHASGHIVELLVKDNQFVHEGDLLFTIDPRPYEHTVARSRANLVLTRKEVAA